MADVDYDDFQDYDDGWECTMCGGDGYVECNDPIQCCKPHTGNGWDQMCACSACNGSGLAKDQTIW